MEDWAINLGFEIAKWVEKHFGKIGGYTLSFIIIAGFVSLVCFTLRDLYKERKSRKEDFRNK